MNVVQIISRPVKFRLLSTIIIILVLRAEGIYILMVMEFMVAVMTLIIMEVDIEMMTGMDINEHKIWDSLNYGIYGSSSSKNTQNPLYQTHQPNQNRPTFKNPPTDHQPNKNRLTTDPAPKSTRVITHFQTITYLH